MIEAAAIALILTMLTAIPAVTLGSGATSLVLRSNGMGTFAVSTVAITVGLLIGRLRARARLPLPALAGFSAAMRETVTLALFGAAVFTSVAIVAALKEADARRCLVPEDLLCVCSGSAGCSVGVDGSISTGFS